MKNMMIAATCLAIFPLATFARPLPCAKDGHPDESVHCTEFVDNIPEGVKYQMEFTFHHNDVNLGSFPMCLSSSSILELQNDALPGKYTEVYSLAYLTADGEIDYRYYDSQTYKYSGKGFASPQFYTINLPPVAGAVTCSDEMNAKATGLEEFFRLHTNNQ